MADPPSAELWPTVISAAASLAAGVGLWLQNRATAKKLDANTATTEATKSALDAVNAAQLDYAELYELRRWRAAFDTLPECGECKAAVERMADRRRLRPHPPKEAQP